MGQASAIAHPNIAFIKYWGNRDEALRLPVNGSLSMNLDGLITQTTVNWRDDLAVDSLTLNGDLVEGAALARVSEHLTAIRRRLGISLFAEVESSNNFPMGAGIASSAAAFAALTVAAVRAAGAEVPERELTTLARLGSGSASRSVPAGFVEWHMGDAHETSYAESIAPSDHWALVDVIAVISGEHKAVGSRAGHTTAGTSDLQAARVAGAQSRLDTCRRAVLERDFMAFAEVVEQDSNLMHAVMMTSTPPLFYWLPATLTVMDRVRYWRSNGLNLCYTLDAGPNVHCICTADHAQKVADELARVPGVGQVLVAGVGGAARGIQP